MSSATNPTVIVLLPVYNGEKYLRQQLDSILGQSLNYILLLCRDDCSSDNSAAILNEYAERYPAVVSLLMEPKENLGARGSFSLLMQTVLNQGLLESRAPAYVALADQDDLWYPDKLSRCVDLMQEQESITPGAPVAIHGDLRVVSEDGALVAPSMAVYQGLEPRRRGFAAQLLSNTLTGCTVLMNGALLKQSLPISPDAIMHDWWLALVVSAFGHSRYIDEPLLDYRQHGANTIGAKQYTKPSIKRGLLKRLLDRRNADILKSTAVQARAFLKAYPEQLSLRQKAVLRMASLLSVNNPLLQRITFRVLRRL